MDIEKQIEFDRIKEKWASLAVTKQAKEIIKNQSFYLSESELRRNLKDTTDGRDLIEKFGTPPLPETEEIKEIIMAAQKGECLTPYQLERLERVLAAINRLKDYLKRGRIYGNNIAYYEENLYPENDLREEISRQIRNGEVDDYASKGLLQVRRQIAKTEEQIKENINKHIVENLIFLLNYPYNIKKKLKYQVKNK